MFDYIFHNSQDAAGLFMYKRVDHNCILSMWRKPLLILKFVLFLQKLFYLLMFEAQDVKTTVVLGGKHEHRATGKECCNNPH